MIKRKIVFTILIAYLLTGGLYLLSPGESAWAVPGQNPKRQSAPTRTATPGAIPTPGTATPAPPGSTAAPPGNTPTPSPQSQPLLLPAETVTPLFLTLFPPTATPMATFEGLVFPTETMGEGAGATPTPTPGEMVQSIASATPAAPTITPVILPSLADAVGAGACANLLVVGAGLVMLVVGLVLVGRRQAAS